MFKKILLIVLLMLNVSEVRASDIHTVMKQVVDASNVSCSELSKNGFSDHQIKNMYVSFRYGKHNNMSYSLAAIAFNESSAGKPQFMKNPKDPSAGMHGVTLDKVVKKFDLKDNKIGYEMAEDILVNSHAASAWFAMDTLGWWLNYHKGDWNKAYRSYNAGFYWRGSDALQKRSENYVKKINNTIRMLKKCGWK